MTALGPHAAFIIGAYGIATIVLAALIAWIALDRRALRRDLTALEDRGIRRRSARRGEAA
jgi:heme exporter protein D